jgi:hypothetical protein
LQLASEAQVKPAGYDHFYKVLRMLAQWELLDESDDRSFSANLATRQLVCSPSLIPIPESFASALIPRVVVLTAAEFSRTFASGRCWSLTPGFRPSRPLARLNVSVIWSKEVRAAPPVLLRGDGGRGCCMFCTAESLNEWNSYQVCDLQVRGKEATLGHFVDHQINKPKWEAWKFLPEAVQQGEVAFALAHGGSDMHQVG